ncbi:MAG: helix-turn-helix domain-containing protein [Methanomassiliicoccales archaeon]|nr:helix-turn-helix domain-containing protein [Methanomassiliicoccales archaeon]
MMEAVISLKMPEKWIKDALMQYPSVIKIIGSKPVNGHAVRDLVEIEVEREEDVPSVIESIRSSPNIFNVDITPIERGKVLAIFSTTECAVCRLLAHTDCFLTSSTSTKDGRLEWSLLLTEKEPLQKLMKNLEKAGAEPKLIKITEISDKDALTARQEQITRMAFEKGYFDFPRKISLKQLAKSLGVSTSTLSEILRKGQKRILAKYFREHREV